MFAVTQIDSFAQLALPRTEADGIASTLPEPRGATMRPLSSSFTTNPSTSSAPVPNSSTETAGFEDEDYELQAALQASLMGSRAASEYYHYESAPLSPPRLARGFAPLPPSDPQTPSSSGSVLQTPNPEPSIPSAEQLADMDPVAASMERNRLMLQQMREEQEHAQLELWAENAAAMEARRRERQREEEEEAELLRRAIEESEAMARAEGHARNKGEDDDDVDMGSEVPVSQTARPNVGHPFSDRVYDDDDAELQAALKASLEHVPDGWELPEMHDHQTPVPPFSSAAPVGNHNAGKERERDREDAESVLSDETTTTMTDNTAPDVSVEAVSVDELRKKRLARFGA